MLYRTFGAIGYVLVVAGMLTLALDWTSFTLSCIIAIAGLVSLGIEENRAGKRHWLVKYVDYAPLFILGLIYIVVREQQNLAVWLLSAIIPLSAISGWYANRLARKPRFRSLRKIEDLIPETPGTKKEHHPHQHYRQ
ncbi:hypothetical protein [Paenibacillus assamensis]|uniref:hypothetical protein n=1 Tax=Paenibacillus assamensis TaxID=311244 RepID=UPI00041C11EE|nr:hypothetical protein [Paenibacillus assamensis]